MTLFFLGALLGLFAGTVTTVAVMAVYMAGGDVDVTVEEVARR